MLRSIAIKPDMSLTFISDVKLILSRMNIWVNTAIGARDCRLALMIFAYNTKKIHGRVLSKGDMSMVQVNTVNTLTKKQISLLLECKNKTFNAFANIVREWLFLHTLAKVMFIQ